MKKKPALNQTPPLLFSLILTCLFILPPPQAAQARMKQLTMLQNGVFHLTQTDLVFTSRTFYTDRFIDDEQADEFAEASKTEPYLPADQDYPFTLIDHHVLDSDLEILYDYDCIACCPYPARAYLSRHNISIADYTDQKSPPEVFYNVITGKEPYHHERVKAIYWKLTNHEVYQDEFLHERGISPRKVGYTRVQEPGKVRYTIVQEPGKVRYSSVQGPGEIRVQEPGEVRYTRIQEPGPCPGVVRYKSVPEITEDFYLGGYMIDAYVRVISGCVSVWVGESHPPCPVLKRVPMPKKPCPGVVTSKQEIVQLTRMPSYGPPYTCMKSSSPREKEPGPCRGVVRYKPTPKGTYVFPTGQTYETRTAPPKATAQKNTQCAFCR